MEKDILVAFEDRIEIVKGVKWNTTAETLIKRYINLAADLENMTSSHRSSVYIAIASCG